MSRWTVLLTVFIIMCALGCSGDNGPLAPPGDEGITAETTIDTQNSGNYLWGYYDVHVDIENQTVEAIPNRTVMGVEPSPFNVVQFLNDNPASLKFTVNDILVNPGAGLYRCRYRCRYHTSLPRHAAVQRL